MIVFYGAKDGVKHVITISTKTDSHCWLVRHNGEELRECFNIWTTPLLQVLTDTLHTITNTPKPDEQQTFADTTARLGFTSVDYRIG